MRWLGVTVLGLVLGCSSGSDGTDGNDGADGSDGAPSLVRLTPEVPGENCADGGTVVEAGIDANRDGVLDVGEISSTHYVCSGANGVDANAALVRLEPEVSGPNCADGGVAVLTGSDDNGNGVLDTPEVQTTRYVCNGENGTSVSQFTLVRLEAEPAGPNCAVGGTAVHNGLDVDSNGVLDPGEETNTTYYCGTTAPTVLNGSVTVLNETDLAFLSGVTTVTGDLRIEDADGLQDLTGLGSLQSVAGDLSIHRNDDLTSLAGLDNLTTVLGTLDIWTNPVLQTVAVPLGSLTTVGNLFVENNYVLTLGETDALLALAGLNVSGDTVIEFNADPYEPNNTDTEAFVVANGFGDEPFNLHPGDVDWFRVTIDSDNNGTPGDTVALFRLFVFGEDVDNNGTPDETPPKTVAAVFDLGGNLIMRNDELLPGGIQSRVEVPLLDGDYLLAVSGQGDNGFVGAHEVEGVYEFFLASDMTVPTGSISGRILADTLYSPSTFYSLDRVPQDAQFAEAEMLVRFVAGVSVGEQAVLASAMGLEIVRNVGEAVLLRQVGASGPRTTTTRATTSGDATLRSMGDLLALPQVKGAEPNFLRHPTLAPDDPRYPEQWHLANLGMEAAWDITTGSGGVTVAVLDTGVVAGHEDLACGRLLPGYDFVDDDMTPEDTDPAFHGTHVLGTVGACSNQTLGVAGMDWASMLLPIRVLTSSGGFDSDIADGIHYAVNSVLSPVVNANPADVLNLSLGGLGESRTLQAAIDEANALGAIVVVAAGNDDIDVSSFTPANAQGVITVGAVGPLGVRAGYSNFGPLIDVYGPGGDHFSLGYYRVWDGVLSLSDPSVGTYRFLHGTSMAAPHIAGLASLMKAVNPALNWYTARSYMQVGVAPVPGESAGSVDAASALAAAQADGPQPGAVFPERTIVDLGTGSVDNLMFTNFGDEVATYTITSDESRLTTTPTMSSLSGGASEAVQIDLDRVGLDDGAFESILTITSSPSGEEMTIAVRYTEGTATNAFPSVTVWAEQDYFGSGTRYIYRRIYDLSRTAGHYDYALTDLPDATYEVFALIDQDGDGTADFVGLAGGPVVVAGGSMETGIDLTVSAL